MARAREVGANGAGANEVGAANEVGLTWSGRENVVGA